MAKRLHFQDHRFGSDPVWGAGDTRKYNRYATPPPTNYQEKIKLDAYNKTHPVKDIYPEGFITPEMLQKEAEAIQTTREVKK